MRGAGRAPEKGRGDTDLGARLLLITPSGYSVETDVLLLCREGHGTALVAVVPQLSFPYQYSQ